MSDSNSIMTATGALNDFFNSLGASYLQIATDSAGGVQLLYRGVSIPGVNVLGAIGIYSELVNEGYSSADAAARAGSALFAGIAGGATTELIMTSIDVENPWLNALASSLASEGMEKLGSGPLYDAGMWLGGEIYNLQTDLSNLFVNPTTSNILLSNLTTPTGFTSTPTPFSLAGIYDTTTSQSIASWQFTQVTASAVQQAESTGVYVIQAGNTLSDIAKQFGTTMEAIMEANPDITKANMIYAGQEIILPTSNNTTTSLDPTAYQFDAYGVHTGSF